MKKIILAVIMLIPSLAFANPGYYLQGEIGPSVDPFPGGGVGLNVGYLWGNNNFNYGLEAGISGNAGFDFLFASSGINLSALGIAKYTFDSGFVTFAKAGFAYLDLTVGDDFGIGNIPVVGIGPEIALGIGYQFNPHWEIDLTASAVDTFASSHNDGVSSDGAGSLFLGLTYHFA